MAASHATSSNPGLRREGADDRSPLLAQRVAQLNSSLLSVRANASSISSASSSSRQPLPVTFGTLTRADVAFFDVVVASLPRGAADFTSLKRAYNAARALPLPKQCDEQKDAFLWDKTLCLVQVRGHDWSSRWDAVRIALGLEPRSTSSGEDPTLRSEDASESSEEDVTTGGSADELERWRLQAAHNNLTRTQGRTTAGSAILSGRGRQLEQQSKLRSLAAQARALSLQTARHHGQRNDTRMSANESPERRARQTIDYGADPLLKSSSRPFADWVARAFTRLCPLDSEAKLPRAVSLKAIEALMLLLIVTHPLEAFSSEAFVGTFDARSRLQALYRQSQDALAADEADQAGAPLAPSRLPSLSPAAFVLAACKEYLKPARNRRALTFWPSWIKSRPWPASRAPSAPRSNQPSRPREHLRPPTLSTMTYEKGAGDSRREYSLSPTACATHACDDSYRAVASMRSGESPQRSQQCVAQHGGRHHPTTCAIPGSGVTPSSATPQQPRGMSAAHQASFQSSGSATGWTASSYHSGTSDATLGNAFSQAALDRQLQTPRLLKRKTTPETREADSYQSQEELRVRGCSRWRD